MKYFFLHLVTKLNIGGFGYHQIYFPWVQHNWFSLSNDVSIHVNQIKYVARVFAAILCLIWVLCCLYVLSSKHIWRAFTPNSFTKYLLSLYQALLRNQILQIWGITLLICIIYTSSLLCPRSSPDSCPCPMLFNLIPDFPINPRPQTNIFLVALSFSLLVFPLRFLVCQLVNFEKSFGM